MKLSDLLFLRLPLAVWVGATAFAAISAPAVFHELSSRDVAGRLVGEILRRLEALFHVLSILLVVGVFSAVGREGRIAGRAAVTAVGIFLAIATNVYSSMVLRPRMAYYRAQAGSFDETPPEDPWRRKFQTLHRRSTRILVVGLAAAVVSLAFAP